MIEETAGAERYGFWLQTMRPGQDYPFEHIRGFYRVPMFQAGLLEAVDVDALPPTMRLTAKGEAALATRPAT